MNRPLRFGICGCGGIAGLHAECFARLETQDIAKIVAGADPRPSHRERFGAKWNIPIAESLEEMLKRDDLDAVVVCSPSGMHGQHCATIARSGRHVLCEKPMDLRVEQIDLAIEAARKANVILGGIFQQRFTSGAMKVKRAIDAGYFGKIVMVHCETPWYRTQAYYDSGDWRGTWAMDCGVLANQAPHMIDRILWLGGDVADVISATCDPGRERNIEAETLAVATVRLVNGALGTITGTTLAYDGLPQRVLICGTEGSAAFENDTLSHFKTIKPFEESVAPDSTTASASTSTGGENKAANPLAMSTNSHEANIRDFIDAINENRAPMVTADDQRRVVRVLNLIYERAGVGPFKR